MTAAPKREPILQRAYPEEGATWLQRIIHALGVLVVVAGVAISLAHPFIKSFPGFLLTAGGAIVFFYAGIKAGNWYRNLRWSEAFFANNADLNLDRKAIENVIRHMRSNTAYRCVDFPTIASVIAITLREEGAQGAGTIQNIFYHEVLLNYKHFAHGEGSPVETYSPKWVWRIRRRERR